MEEKEKGVIASQITYAYDQNGNMVKKVLEEGTTKKTSEASYEILYRPAALPDEFLDMWQLAQPQ